MAEGDLFDDNLPQVIIQFNEVDELFLMDFGHNMWLTQQS